MLRKKGNAYVKKIDYELKKAKTEAEQDQLLADVWKQNILSQKLTVSQGEGKHRLITSLDAKETKPIYTFDAAGRQTLLLPIGAKAIYAKADIKKDGNPKEGAIPLGYSGGRFDTKYQSEGVDIKPQDVMAQYNAFVRTRMRELGDAKKTGDQKAIQAARGNLWKGGFDSWLRQAIDENFIQVELKGENGRTNMLINGGAYRAISNKNTKKGQTQPFESDDPVIDDSNDGEGEDRRQ